MNLNDFFLDHQFPADHTLIVQGAHINRFVSTQTNQLGHRLSHRRSLLKSMTAEADGHIKSFESRMLPKRGIAVEPIHFIETRLSFDQFKSVENGDTASEDRPHRLVEERIVHLKVEPWGLLQN